MKKKNKMDASKLFFGLNFGEHVVDHDTIISEIDRETKMTADVFFLRSKSANPLSDEAYIELAKFAKRRNLRFAILYAYQHPPKNRRSHLTEFAVRKMKEIAGELFLGEVFAELSSQSVSQDEGYYVDNDFEQLVKPPQNFSTMSSARERYVSLLSEMLEYNKSIGIDKSIYVDPTAIGAYALESGMDILFLEMLPGDPEKTVAFTRGASIGHEREAWGGFVAHEWYGGFIHNDELKIKRLDLSYKYLFMAGANYIFLESGNTGIESYGYKYPYESKECSRYRAFTKKFYKFAKENPRLKNGPMADVAFIMGEDDGYADFLGSSAWCQFGREEWGKSEREYSWRILDEVYRSYNWFSQENLAFNKVDLSSAPAYGTYDVLPASSPLSVLKKYKYLIFVGHNTMSGELYEKLVSFVRAGGILLASAAHMNSNSERLGEVDFYNSGDLSELFGVKINSIERKNHGVKFYTGSNVKNLVYPAAKDLKCDAYYPMGYVDVASVDLCGASVYARLCDAVTVPREDELPILTEYKNGKGVALFLTHVNYPGNMGVYETYKTVVKALLTASHANASVKVFGSDKVRFSVFSDDGGNKTLYLLNTAFDVLSSVGVIHKNKTEYYTLAPTELKILNLGK